MLSEQPSCNSVFVHPFVEHLGDQTRAYGAMVQRNPEGAVDWPRITRHLCREDTWDKQSWSPEDAVKMVTLAREHGWWMLAHATALAAACDHEHGDC